MSSDLRIVSLLPSATEIVYALDLGDHLAGRSNDSDYPPDALSVPVVSAPDIPVGGSSADIDAAVRGSLHTGRSVFHLEAEILQELRPTLILTQELCDVCAPSFTDVRNATKILSGEITILSLEPESIEGMFENIFTVGEICHRPAEAMKVVRNSRRTISEIEAKLQNVSFPTVVVVEWMDPVMIAGHWVPEMVTRAGGKKLLSRPGEKSRRVAWEEIIEVNPEFVIISPCGFDVERAKMELTLLESREGWGSLTAVKRGRVYLVDGDAYITRSGPRLIRGVEILAKVFHPDIFGDPTRDEAQRMDHERGGS